MAKTKIIDYVGFGLGVFGLFMFTVMYLTSAVSTDLGKAIFGFFVFAALGGAVYFGHKIWLT